MLRKTILCVTYDDDTRMCVEGSSRSVILCSRVSSRCAHTSSSSRSDSSISPATVVTAVLSVVGVALVNVGNIK